MKRGMIFLISILLLSLIIITDNYRENEEVEEGFLNSLFDVFSLKLFAEYPFVGEGYGYGDEDKECNEECVDRYGCFGEGIGVETASCNEGKCVYSDTEVFEECGVCEKCGMIDYSEFVDVDTSSEKPHVDFSILKNLEDLSGPLGKLVMNGVFGDIGNVLYGVGVGGLMMGFFGQVGSSDGFGGDVEGGGVIRIPIFDSSWMNQPNGGPNSYVQPRCLSQEECEREKNMCSEYSNKEKVKAYCGNQMSPIYSCTYDKGICKTPNFVIRDIQGVPPLQAKQECCDWAKRFEFEKCKNEVDIGINAFAKKYLKGGDYGGRTLNGEVIINIQNKMNGASGSSISKHSRDKNTIILTGTAEEISQELLPGEAANFVLTKAFNKADWTPPWVSQGLKEVLSESRCGKCDSFKKLAEMKDSIDLKDILSEENAGRISESQSIVGYGFLEFLMSKDDKYVEKNVGYQRLILQFLFQGYENKNPWGGGLRTYHVWEDAMRDKEYSYGFDNIEVAEAEFKKWIEDSMSGINPCNCLTRGEVEKGVGVSPC